MISAGFTAPPRQIVARSGIGSVAIRVPSGTAYRVTASTQIGSVRVPVPRAAASSHVIHAATSTGTVTVTGS
jgi:predicted membrane protein